MDQLGPRGRGRRRSRGGEPPGHHLLPQLGGPARDVAAHVIQSIERVAPLPFGGEDRRVAERAQRRGEQREIALGEGVERVEIARLGRQREQRRRRAARAAAQPALQRPPRVVASPLGERERRGPGRIVERRRRRDHAPHPIDEHHVARRGHQRRHEIGRALGVEHEGPQREIQGDFRVAAPQRQARMHQRRAAVERVVARHLLHLVRGLRRVALRERALGPPHRDLAIDDGERRRDPIEPALRPRRIAGREIQIRQVEQRQPRRLALVGRRGRPLQRRARVGPLDPPPRAAEAQPHVSAPRDLLRELRQRRHDLVVEPRVLGRVGPEREPERRLGQAREDRPRVLARLERLPLRQRLFGGLALAVEAEREDLDAPEEAGKSLDEPRHGRIKEPTRA